MLMGLPAENLGSLKVSLIMVPDKCVSNKLCKIPFCIVYINIYIMKFKIEIRQRSL
jgi:hypothetical protein